MRTKLILSGMIAAVLLTTGCAASVGYRVYDPYYADYHAWGPGEGIYYNRWIVETHRPYRDYGRLDRDDQRAYWNWRHRDHDRR